MNNTKEKRKEQYEAYYQIAQELAKYKIIMPNREQSGIQRIDDFYVYLINGVKVTREYARRHHARIDKRQ